jgi:hypothetical protein
MNTKILADPIFKEKGGEKKMKYSKIFIGVIGTVLIVGISITSITSWAAEDVRNSRHNLSASRTIDNKVQSATTEVCVFCHTPHGGDMVANGAAPIWNRTGTAALTGYTPYISPNFDAAGVTPGTPKGVSLACLSCHDGTVAFDNLINYPGSASGTTNANSIGLVKPTARVDSNGMMKNDGTLEAPLLGQNLSNDHPISMEVPCTTAPPDPQFSQICANLTANGTKVTYITRETGIYPTDSRDRLRTYPTNGAGTYSIECASCHNPHENLSTRFLRHPSINANNPLYGGITAGALDVDRNSGSLLCLSCHQK